MDRARTAHKGKLCEKKANCPTDPFTVLHKKVHGGIEYIVNQQLARFGSLFAQDSAVAELFLLNHIEGIAADSGWQSPMLACDWLTTCVLGALKREQAGDK